MRVCVRVRPMHLWCCAGALYFRVRSFPPCRHWRAPRPRRSAALLLLFLARRRRRQRLARVVEAQAKVKPVESQDKAAAASAAAAVAASAAAAETIKGWAACMRGKLKTVGNGYQPAEVLLVQKRGGVLRIDDCGGWAQRNESMARLLRAADAANGTGDALPDIAPRSCRRPTAASLSAASRPRMAHRAPRPPVRILRCSLCTSGRTNRCPVGCSSHCHR